MRTCTLDVMYNVYCQVYEEEEEEEEAPFHYFVSLCLQQIILHKFH